MEAITETKKGTTTVGIVFKEGVVLAADKRASMGYMIANKHVDKVLKITDEILMTVAGGVGDAQAISKYLKAEAKLYELKNDRRIGIKALASYLQIILYSGKGGYFPFQVQLILAGKSKKNDFLLFSFDAAGSKLTEDYVSTGSGSPFAYGVLEEGYKPNMNEKQATDLVSKAIRTAIKRDMGTGEGVDVWILNKTGLNKKETQKFTG